MNIAVADGQNLTVYHQFVGLGFVQYQKEHSPESGQ
jgi:hypothetical protein